MLKSFDSDNSVVLIYMIYISMYEDIKIYIYIYISFIAKLYREPNLGANM